MSSIYLPNEILVIASYPPRECGIASYSKDLINALSQSVSNSFSVSVCALEKGKVIRNYPSEVKYVLDTGILVDFQNPKQFSHALLRILSDNTLHDSMSKNAINKSSVSEWKNVATRYTFMM